MLLNSLEFFLFLPAVWVVHHLIAQRFRWLFLLIVSYLFYASLKAPFLLGVIFFVTLQTYFFGRWIYQTPDPKIKRRMLWMGIFANVLVLILLKYIPFITENIRLFLNFFESPISSLHAPIFIAVGVSYYIFQAISYLSDIYLDIEKPENHFGHFALYLAFFPKLLQGPIERAGDLLPQLKQKYAFNYENVRFGLMLFAWGLFKKVILADRLGLYVDSVYDDVTSYQGLTLLLASYAYALQIYFDFSGYTDMALGIARMFNINLTNNFNRPYLATSIADFWRRWHISFSRWILDYIFKPLQMQWRSALSWGTALALIVTFLVSGIWHGATWGFVVWGLLHGMYLACSVFYKPYQKRIHKALLLEKTRMLRYWQIFVTFNLVCFGWIFFRANSISDAAYIIANILTFSGGGVADFLLTHGRIEILILLFSLSLMALVQYLQLSSGRNIIVEYISDKHLIVRWFAYVSLVIFMLIFASAERGFIYNEF